MSSLFARSFQRPPRRWAAALRRDLGEWSDVSRLGRGFLLRRFFLLLGQLLFLPASVQKLADAGIGEDHVLRTGRVQAELLRRKTLCQSEFHDLGSDLTPVRDVAVIDGGGFLDARDSLLLRLQCPLLPSLLGLLVDGHDIPSDLIPVILPLLQLA